MLPTDNAPLLTRPVGSRFFAIVRAFRGKKLRTNGWLLAALLLSLPGWATTYRVGPGQPYTSIGSVPWFSLQPGDSVKIYWRSTPYREKFQVSGRGTANQWIRVVGVPGPAGQLPVISGDAATTSTNMHFRTPAANDPNSIQWYGVVHVAAGPGQNALPPAYIEIANLQIQDGYKDYSFTGEDGTTVAYDSFCAGIYAKSVNHLLIRNNIITNCGQGIYNWTAAGPDIWWAGLQSNTVIRGNYFYNNGNPGGYLEHQTYTESDGVIIEYNHYGPQRPGSQGSQLKDRSAGTVIRYNYFDQSLAGYDLDLVEPENGWDAIGTKNTYRQTFVYGNVIVNNGASYAPNYVHWNEDHQNNVGRANQAGGKLFFYHNTVLTTANQTDTWAFHLFNTTYGSYDCNPSPLPGTIDARNNLIVLRPRTAGAAVPNFQLAYCPNTNLVLNNNWISPGWTTGSTASVTGVATTTSPAANNPDFVDPAAPDLHLRAGSTALGMGGPLAPEVTANYLGLDLTPTEQYVSHQQSAPRAAAGAGASAGAYEGAAGPACGYALASTAVSVAAAGGSGSVALTASAGCSWTANSSAAWVVPTPASGTGSVTISYTVAANAGIARSCTLTIGGQVLTISQAAGSSDATAPTVTLTAPAAGATVSGTIAVTAAATDNVGVVGVRFLVDGVAFGTEDLTAPYSRNSNTTTLTNGLHTFAARARDAAGNVTTSAGVVVTVRNCGYALATATAAYSAAAATGSVALTAGAGCTWTATSSATWLTLAPGSSSGSGNATLAYAVAANPGPARTATLTVGGQVLTVSQAVAATVPSIDIATFQGNKAASIVFTFDDALPSHPQEVRAVLNQHGIKATFFVVTNRISNWAPWVAMDQEGHEIGNHSFGHYFPDWQPATIQQQVTDAYNDIVNHVGHCYTWAYPFGLDDPAADAVIFQQHIASRYKTDPTGPDYAPITIGYDGSAYTSVAQFNQDVDNIIAGVQVWDRTLNDFVTSHVLSTLTHATTLPKDAGFYNPMDLNIIDQNLAYVQSKQNQLWVATYGDNYRYWNERRNSTVTRLGATAASVDFTLTNSLDPTLYFTPLTVVITPPGSGVPVNPQVTRDAGGSPATVSVQGNKLLVNLLAGPQAVHVSWSNGNPLPVELVAFTARRGAGQAVQLAWHTAQEVNNAGFTVEKSMDGLRFEPLAFVPGAENPATPRQYSYDDQSAPATYYRLRQQDRSGVITYSPVQFVPAADRAAMARLELAPNPARRHPVEVHYAGPAAPVGLYSLQGQQLRQWPAGTTALDVRGLAAGVYVVRVGTQVTRLLVE